MNLIIMFVALVALILLGVPIAYSLGGSGILYLLLDNPSFLMSFPQRVWSGADSFILIAMPLFMLSGELMNHGGLTKRLVDFSLLLVKSIKGGACGSKCRSFYDIRQHYRIFSSGYFRTWKHTDSGYGQKRISKGIHDGGDSRLFDDGNDYPSQHTDADVRNGQRHERGKIIHGGTDTRLDDRNLSTRIYMDRITETWIS